MGSAFAAILTVVVKMGATLSDDEYHKLVVPAIVKLFSVQERQVRVHLLRHLHQYAKHLPPKVVEEKILPNVATGFNDANAVLRELTLKSLIHLAPKLSKNTMDTDVLRHLTKMQNDPEPGIRTNSIYCIAKVCGTFSDGKRRQILYRAFLKGLRDPFGPARLASLGSLQVCVSHFNADDVAKRILPSAVVLAVDPNEPVRKACLKMMGVMAAFLAQASDQRAKAAKEGKQNAIGSSDKTNAHSKATEAAQRYGGAMLSTMASWASTGITAVAKYAAKNKEGHPQQSSGSANGPRGMSTKAVNNCAPTPASVKPNDVASGGSRVAQMNSYDSTKTGPSTETPARNGWDDGDLDLDLFDDNDDDNSAPMQALSLGSKKDKKSIKKSRAKRPSTRRTRTSKSKLDAAIAPAASIDPWGGESNSGGGDGGAMDLSQMLSEDTSSGGLTNGNDASLDNMLSMLNDGGSTNKSQTEVKSNGSDFLMEMGNNHNDSNSNNGWGSSGGNALDDILGSGGSHGNNSAALGKSVLQSGKADNGSDEVDDWGSFMKEALDS